MFLNYVYFSLLNIASFEEVANVLTDFTLCIVFLVAAETCQLWTIPVDFGSWELLEIVGWSKWLSDINLSEFDFLVFLCKACELWLPLSPYFSIEGYDSEAILANGCG